MKAIVLGGGGYLAVPLLVYFVDQKSISDILITDIKENKIKERAAWLNSYVGRKKYTTKVLDLNDSNSVVKAIKGYDIVLNTTNIQDKIPTMKAVLEAGTNYIDCGVEQVEAKLALSDDFKKKGLTAIFDMYFSPGLHNIMGAYGVERLDTVDSLDYRWAIMDIVPGSEHSRLLYGAINFADYLLHHFVRSARRWENGKMIELLPRAEPEIFTFKGPIGTAIVAGLPGDSLTAMSVLRPDIKRITFKEALGDALEEKCKFLAGTGFNQTEPINIDGQLIAPWKVTQYLLNNQSRETKRPPDVRHGGCAIARGVKDGQKIEYRVEAWPSENLVQKHKDMNCAKYGGPGGIFRCGSPMGSAAVLMARGEIKAKGVFLPDFTVPSKEFFEQEASSGMNVEITKTLLL